MVARCIPLHLDVRLEPVFRPNHPLKRGTVFPEIVPTPSNTRDAAAAKKRCKTGGQVSDTLQMRAKVMCSPILR